MYQIIFPNFVATAVTIGNYYGKTKVLAISEQTNESKAA